MNVEYYINELGTIIVIDENHNLREIEKSGKYKEILIQENIIETIENRIKELEEILEKYPKEEVNNKRFIPLATIIAIISSLSLPFINCTLMTNSTIHVESFFEAIKLLNESLSFMSTLMMLASLLGVVIDIARYSDYNEYIKKLSADNLELETLKRILPKEKEKLNNLNLDKTKYRLPSKYKANFLHPVKDQEQLNILEEYIKLYRRLGRLLPSLYESYQNNTLRKSLQEYGYSLNKEEYEIIVNYIKEKENIISPRKKKIKKHI